MTEPKVALVTGACGGIGNATVAAFREAGFEVFGADREPGSDITVDLATAVGAQEAVATATERHGTLHAVVVAHGVSGRSLGDGPVAACSDEAWDAVLDANLRSTFYVCREAVPRLIEAGGGALVTIGSVLGLVGGDEDFDTVAYATSKAGIIGLTRAIAVRHARDGVRANVVAPGVIRTPMSTRAQKDAHIRDRVRELQPLTGDLGKPADVAQAALYLAQAEFVTGTVLVVDGGWTAK
jgi:NAD(P)-dependent dehydrogenase (short-subunit alcohol dehydrogenase family)